MSRALTRPRVTLPTGGQVPLLARKLAWFAPLVFVAVYLVTLALQVSRLLAGAYLNADAASAPVIGELFGERTDHPLTLLGHLGWYSTLLFERATHWLPLHRQVWEGAPYAMALGSAVLVGWGVWRVAGRWAGAIAVAIVVCAGPEMLSLLFVLNDHAPTWFTLALLGAFVVVLESRADVLSWMWLCVLTLVAGAVLGANAASDVLLTIAGAVPMLLAAGATWLLHPNPRSARAACLALAAGAVAIVAGVLLHAYMHHQNVFAAVDPKTNTLAAAESVGTNFRLWWQSLAALGNGNFFGQAIGFSTVLAFACAVLTITAVLVLPRIARSEFRSALAAGRRAPHSPEQSARLAWCLFWGSSAVLLTAAFIFSGIPEDLGSNRYLVGLILAAAALVPLLGRRSTLARAAVTAAVTLYAFTGWLALAQERIGPPASPSDQLANAVLKFARDENLAVGYGGYWDAAPVTWATHLGVKVFPVQECDGNQHLCGFELHVITSWYKPRPGARSFLLSDPAYPGVPSAPTPDLGKPIAVHQIGQVMMYVYPYDIASRLFAL
jgi:hypothetical protein